MKRTTIASAALTAILAGVSLPSQAFDLFGLFSKNDITDMLAYIPDDTAVFVGSISNEEIIEEMEGWIDPTMAQSVSGDMTEIFSQLPESKGLDFFEAFITEYYANAGKGIGAMYEIYGLKRDGASVFYLDGIYPVMRLALEDQKAFMASLERSAAKADYEMQTISLKGESVTVFELVNEEDVQINLGMIIKDDVVTLSFYSGNEAEAALASRFALTKASSPLTKNDWKALGDELELDEYMRGYVSLAGLADIFLNAENSGAQQLTALLPMPLPSTELSTECRAETTALLSGMPRFTFGTQDFSTSGELMKMSIATLLEIDYEPVLTDLSKLVGFVPNYVTENDALTLGIALGLDMDKLVPALTSLWTQFVRAEFECEYLQMAQMQLQSTNPAMLAVATGFAKGVKGVSAGVFNLDTANSEFNYDVDALITLSAEDPSLITSLLSTYLPMNPGETISDGGEPVALPLPLPVEAYIAQKGQHLVVYTGEISKAEADRLAGVKLATNGLSAITLDYQNLGDLMINSAQMLTDLQPESDGDCTQMYVGGLMLKSMDMRLTGRDIFNADGWSSRYSISMDPMAAMEMTNVDLPGTYLLEYMDYDCSWYDSGIEVINADGTGAYTESEEAGSCPMWKSTYEWEESLGVFSQTNSQNFYRDDCESEWIEDEPYDFVCMITAGENGNFYCLETYEDEQTLYRYTRQ